MASVLPKLHIPIGGVWYIIIVLYICACDQHVFYPVVTRTLTNIIVKNKLHVAT